MLLHIGWLFLKKRTGDALLLQGVATLGGSGG